MASVESELRSTALATADFLMAAVGLAIVFYPAVTLGNALLGSPLDPAAERLLLGVLAVGGAYPFVAGDWSLGTLGEYVFALVASAFLVGAVAAVVIVVLGLQLSGEDPLPQAVAFALAYALAYLLVHRRGYARLKRALGAG